VTEARTFFLLLAYEAKGCSWHPEIIPIIRHWLLTIASVRSAERSTKVSPAAQALPLSFNSPRRPERPECSAPGNSTPIS
jgi:hypothetical protein